MIINIIQTITNVLDNNRTVLRTFSTETYELTPEKGKAIKNISNGRIYTATVNIGTKGNLKNYIEIDL